MRHKSTVHAVTAIGIDMGKNTLQEPLSNVTFSQWVDVGAEFSSLIEVPALLRPSAGRLSPPSSSCGRECPAGKE